jgi:UDP-glucuronate decarboxylase
MAALDPTDAHIAASHVVSPDRLNGASVLITGASGIIGSHLVAALHELNRELQLSIRITAAARHTQRMAYLFAGFEDTTLLMLDVTDPKCASSAQQSPFFPYTAVINAASPANPAAFSTQPVETMMANISGTRHLLDLVRGEVQNSPHQQCAMVYISSGEVYGYTRSTDLMTEDMVEDAVINPLDPRSCYPLSKQASETLCASYAKEYGVDVRIARPSHVFGPGFLPSDNRVSADFFSRAHSGLPITLRSAGTDQRTYIYVADVASGILSVLTAGESGNAYNVTISDNLTSLRDFSQAIADQAPVPFSAPNSSAIPSSSSLHRASALSDARLRALGWSPAITLSDGIHRTLSAMNDSADPFSRK